MSDWTGSDAELPGLLDGVYVCNRVWSAWETGTMTEADFIPASGDEDIPRELITWRDAAVAAERKRHAVPPLRTDALVHDLALVLRGVLHPAAEVGPPARLASRRLAEVLGIRDGEMARDVEARLKSALTSGEG